MLHVEPIGPDRADEIVAVLCDAFHDYPVMRHVLGTTPDDYGVRLRTLIGLFVAARMLRKEPAIGIADGGSLLAVATTTPPGHRDAPRAFLDLREQTWATLGDGPRERYERLGELWQHVAVTEPNLHLNMIGVCGSHTGSGLGRRLLDAVHELSHQDAESTGVSLTTEHKANVPLYEHFGYHIVGHVRIADGLESWGFFRPNPDHDPSKGAS